MKIIPAFLICFFTKHKDVQVNGYVRRCQVCKRYTVLDFKGRYVKIKPFTSVFHPVKNDR